MPPVSFKYTFSKSSNYRTYFQVCPYLGEVDGVDAARSEAGRQPTAHERLHNSRHLHSFLRKIEAGGRGGGGRLPADGKKMRRFFARGRREEGGGGRGGGLVRDTSWNTVRRGLLC